MAYVVRRIEHSWKVCRTEHQAVGHPGDAVGMKSNGRPVAIPARPGGRDDWIVAVQRYGNDRRTAS